MPLYRVTYQPLADVEALAVKRGMKTDDGTSFWDWVGIGECLTTICQTTDFGSAAGHARSFAERDVCGQTRIEEIVRVHWRGAPPTWETVAGWDVGSRSGSLHAGEPDFREELRVEPGDEVLA